jgi:Concanavalin A-like lectin/glucanases superfamily
MMKLKSWVLPLVISCVLLFSVLSDVSGQPASFSSYVSFDVESTGLSGVYSWSFGTGSNSWTGDQQDGYGVSSILGYDDWLGLYLYDIDASSWNEAVYIHRQDWGIPDDPVAYYKFDTDTLDYSGNANHATVVGDLHQGTGKVGGAYFCDFLELGHLSVPDSPSLQISGDEITLCAWVYLLRSGPPILYKMDETGGTGGYSLSLASGGYIHFIGIFSGTGAVPRTEQNAPLSTQIWTHVAVVYDGMVIKFYKNGILMDTQILSGNLATDSTPLQIGGAGFIGGLDEVRIYGRALSASEIAALPGL